MGTRGAICRLTESGFEGRYHHWDSYPEGLGKTLWNLYHGHFKKDLEAMLKTLIDDHPAGWSTINDKDFNLKPGFLTYTTKDIDEKTEKYRTPLCYCHGDRNESEWLVTEKDASDSGVEWVYAFDKLKNVMIILASFNEDQTKMIGAFGCGNENATWRPVATVDLEGQEPDWENIHEEIREQSRAIYEEQRKRKTEQFLKNVKEAMAQAQPFGLLESIPMTHFILWYKEDVSQNLDDDTKIDVAQRISKLTLRSPIWEDKETNYIKQFPELAPYSSTKQISGMQLCAVMKAIVMEMQK